MEVSIQEIHDTADDVIDKVNQHVDARMEQFKNEPPENVPSQTQGQDTATKPAINPRFNVNPE